MIKFTKTTLLSSAFFLFAATTFIDTQAKASDSFEDFVLIENTAPKKLEADDFFEIPNSNEEDKFAVVQLDDVSEETDAPKSYLSIVAGLFKYHAYEQGLSRGISKIEDSIAEQLGENGGVYVLLVDTAAKVAGYEDVFQAAGEKVGVLSERRSENSTIKNVSYAAWKVAEYFVPGYGASVDYITQAGANVIAGSDTMLEAVAGVSNGKTTGENMAFAASNLVRAGVVLVPGGKIIIAASKGAAKFFGNKNSLTEWALANIFSQNSIDANEATFEFIQDLEEDWEVLELSDSLES